jgi:hypothetical protein
MNIILSLVVLLLIFMSIIPQYGGFHNTGCFMTVSHNFWRLFLMPFWAERCIYRRGYDPQQSESNGYGNLKWCKYDKHVYSSKKCPLIFSCILTLHSLDNHCSNKCSKCPPLDSCDASPKPILYWPLNGSASLKNWPPRSPNLSPLDVHMWEHINDVVHENKLDTDVQNVVSC